jgi:signal transduction histidine kinase
MSETVAAAKARLAEIAQQLARLRDELRSSLETLRGEWEIREQILDIARRMRAAQYELRGLADSLPTASGEADLEEIEDEAAQLRSVIECIIADSLGPAIEGLEKAAQIRLPPADA